MRKTYSKDFKFKVAIEAIRGRHDDRLIGITFPGGRKLNPQMAQTVIGSRVRRV